MEARPIVWLGGLLTLALSAGLPAHAQAVACAPFVKKAATEGTPVDLPSGWFAYAKENTPGVYWSPLQGFSETLVPGTDDVSSWRIEISEDGEWILAGFDRNGGELRLFKRDGSGMTTVPTGGPVERVVSGFVRNGPKGTEVFYGLGEAIRGIAVDLTGATPSLGASRAIISCMFGSEQWPGTGIAGNHIVANNGWGCIDWNVIVSPVWQMVTIPDNGNGTSEMIADRWPYTSPESFMYGCNIALSWDGSMVAHNAGSGWLENFQDTCFPVWDADGSPDHKGPIVMPFMEKTEAPMTVRDFYMQRSLSVNWTLPRYRHGASYESGFDHWAFSNSNDFLISKRSNMPDASGLAEWGAWIVQLSTNTWTSVTPLEVEAIWPAVYFDGDVGSVSRNRQPGGSPPTPAIVGHSARRIELSLPHRWGEARMHVTVADLCGRVVGEIRGAKVDAESRRMVVDFRDESGNDLIPGRYVVCVKAGSLVYTRLLTMIQ